LSINALIFISYELLTVLLPAIIVFVILNKKDKPNWGHFWMVCVFAVYIFAAFYFTGTSTTFDILRYGVELHSGDMINVIPFSHHIFVMGYVLNVFLFMPLGFLLPLIWPKMNKLWCVLLSGLSFSLLIEISQIWSHRATDVDDLIMNTTGAVLGFLAYRLFVKITKREHKRLEYCKYEPLIYVGAMFMGHFLLYNWMWLAKLLYDF